jgi:GR25 family glycosyltransferase involved in LPS biosynthesis
MSELHPYLKNTIFINLEHRSDRREHTIAELQKIGVTGERMNAVKTSDGAIGCTMSHIKCLEMAKSRNWSHVFVCEDDITFLEPSIFLNSLCKFSENDSISKNWDVLLITGNNVPPYTKIDDYCIKVTNNQTMSGYIVHAHYYDTLIANLREGIKGLLKNPTNKREYACDMYWKRLQSQGYWYMITPATVIQYANYSDIEHRDVDYKHLMLDINKEWLFKQQLGMQFH